MNFARLKRWVVITLASVLGLAALYLLLANVLLASGLIQHFANASPDKARMSWQRAWTWWPGKVDVTNYQLWVEDPVLQFDLSVPHAKVDIVLWDLVHRTFHASRVRAEGVSYRFVLKPLPSDRLARLEAFPPIDGQAPHYRAEVLPPFPTGEALEAIWSVRLEDVEASLAELWFLEYRYLGAGQVEGSFALSPLRHLEVGPAKLHLDSGALTVGERAVTSKLDARFEVTIAPVEKPQELGLGLLKAISATLRFESQVKDLSITELYLSDLRLKGVGRLLVDLRVAEGTISDRSVVEVWLPDSVISRQGMVFTGLGYARASLDESGVPVVGATASGHLHVPLAHAESLDAVLTGGEARLLLSDADLAKGVGLKRAWASVDEVRVTDARVITRLVASFVPVLGSLVLGDGPLVASANFSFAPPLTVLRVGNAQLGGAKLTGAARLGENGWSGAAAGSFGAIPLGLTLRDNAVVGVPFAPNTFLTAELAKAGVPAR